MSERPISKSMRACLTYYRDNEHNPERVQRPPYTWNRRQLNKALDLGLLRVGPGGWHILSERGRDQLEEPSHDQ